MTDTDTAMTIVMAMVMMLMTMATDYMDDGGDGYDMRVMMMMR